MTTAVEAIVGVVAGVAIYQLCKPRIYAWFAARKKRRADQMYQAGFDYAAGMLMRHYGDENMLLMLEHQSDDPWGRCDFNLGMQAAIRTHHTEQKAK